MDFEQIVKRIAWLDDGHRKTRRTIVALEERMAALEGNIDAVAKQIKPLNKQIADVDPPRRGWTNSTRSSPNNAKI